MEKMEKMKNKLYLVECFKNNRLINVKRFNTIEEVYNFTFKNLNKNYDDFNVYKQQYNELFNVCLKNIEKILKDL